MRVNILGINIDKLTKNELKNIVKERIEHNIKTKIFTPNTDIILKTEKNKYLRNNINSADILIADGKGLIFASKILNDPLPERIAGIDFGETVLMISEEKKLSVFLLGAKKHVAQKAAYKLTRKNENIKICGTHDGYFNVIENDNLIKKINEASPDILFVCMGFPRQEIWINENMDKLPSVTVAIGLGGSFDVWAGNIKRSPIIFQKLSLEWLWRIINEPRRWKFIFKIPVFFYKTYKQKLIQRRNINGENDY